jgi:hypothetical protein
MRTWLEVRGKELLLRVADAGARYPLVVDPWVQSAKLTASDGAAFDLFGESVSTSGNTVVVGAPGVAGQSQGAADLFVRPKRGWRNMTQTAKLTIPNQPSPGNFGYSVAVSGNTVVVGFGPSSKWGRT